eukprot:1166121-Rhodomonas_salina.1
MATAERVNAVAADGRTATLIVAERLACLLERRCECPCVGFSPSRPTLQKINWCNLAATDSFFSLQTRCHHWADSFSEFWGICGE